MKSTKKSLNLRAFTRAENKKPRQEQGFYEQVNTAVTAQSTHGA